MAERTILAVVGAVCGLCAFAALRLLLRALAETPLPLLDAIGAAMLVPGVVMFLSVCVILLAVAFGED